MGFIPYQTNGWHQRRHWRTSTTQWNNPSNIALNPPATSTNDDVQIFFTTGNWIPHAKPATTASAPAARSHPTLRLSPADWLCSHNPANTPSRHVPIAGSVLSKPSGSHVLSHFLPGSKRWST